MTHNARFMGDFVGGPLESLCECGHDIDRHDSSSVIRGAAALACDVWGCGCEDWESADPDDDGDTWRFDGEEES